MTSADKNATPRYQQIKQDLLDRIAAGEWAVGEAIPPEQTLARDFGVARMTVNRALQDLTQAGVLVRRRGSGTYVAPPRIHTSLLQIRNIADEIAERGHHHDSALLRLETVPATADQALLFGIEAGDPLFRSVIVHRENEVPIQVEDRLVNPAVAPHYLEQDFKSQTPSAYLSMVAPLIGAHYTVEARLPGREIALHLAIGTREPCLVVHRTTRTEDRIASLAVLWHPGQLYQLTGGV
ncbi:histidine utilization repressor [Paludibacterium purpuratum]|uniref:Histidine utilization repressor n=1 Tax=Paludibacterium purpuratum TaxID=1144873 RepID=A0A4R7AZC7_9NEIS|nr:histidine utilization repressor [Paludibacterium purpuratum]TDR73604.1 GntR family histidine utilization transcriptional repressor [Paludibacterium purpuratum]